ncbi:MAG: ADP-ribosylation factor-like protein [archaeon]|nr:ADP-ribosylation factor-like protein [archaeon]
MGSLIQKFWKKVKGIKDMNIFMCGLDAAGKTTILYQLKLGTLQKTIPTVGINVESIQCKNINFVCFDIGGGHIIHRNFYYHYYNNSKAVIWVIDSSDEDRLEEAKNEFDNILNKSNGEKLPFVVFANKQDLKNALSPEEIEKRLELERFNDRPWKVFGSNARTGDGLFVGLNWLADTLNNK